MCWSHSWTAIVKTGENCENETGEYDVHDPQSNLSADGETRKIMITFRAVSPARSGQRARAVFRAGEIVRVYMKSLIHSVLWLLSLCDERN